jgi:uncharacterized protein (TIGR02246 family)
MEQKSGSGSAADRLDIVDVINRYAATVDPRDWAGLRSCFTTDGRMTFPTRVLEGPTAIVEAVSQVVDRMAFQQHLIGSHHVRVDGDVATATSAVHAIQVPKDAGQPVLTTVGTYHDQLRRTADGWKLAHRELRVGYRQRTERDPGGEERAT